jgi:hypothetical protein
MPQNSNKNSHHFRHHIGSSQQLKVLPLADLSSGFQRLFFALQLQLILFPKPKNEAFVYRHHFFGRGNPKCTERDPHGHALGEDSSRATASVMMASELASLRSKKEANSF